MGFPIRWPSCLSADEVVQHYTNFVLILPAVARGFILQALNRLSVDVTMTKSKTVLVVDDDDALRDGLKLALTKQGYLTLEADDGLEAKQLIVGHRPDLVIMDMMMPRWGGFAVLEHFLHAGNAPPFIMITAHQGEKHKAYAQQIGVVDYFHKPFSLDRLLERVDFLLRDKASAPQNPADKDAESVLRIACTACGARIKAPRQLLGQTRACPRCQCRLVIKQQPPEDEGPALIMDFN
jgi:DNA-binding NtrC family response regulator